MDSTIRIKAAVIIINGVLPAELNIKPSLALIKFVPGIVEVALRLSAIVSSTVLGGYQDIIFHFTIFSPLIGSCILCPSFC